MQHRTDALILTCEHGGNRVPRKHSRAFAPIAGLLATHRGWDPGALELARQMACELNAPLYFATTSRLVVDLNRSPGHPRVFSGVSGEFSEPAREQLLEEHYHPFREQVMKAVGAQARRRGKVVHISVHSFTPILAGIRRNADIGLLYDPRRSAERMLATAWREAIRATDPGLRVRMNYPYRGTSDGHTTSLRGRFQPDCYRGIEIEINQAIVRGGAARWAKVRSTVTRGLAVAMGMETQ